MGVGVRVVRLAQRSGVERPLYCGRRFVFLGAVGGRWLCRRCDCRRDWRGDLLDSRNA